MADVIAPITDDQIRAKAMEICAGALVTFDKLDHNRTTAKRGLQKELDRRSEGSFRWVVEDQTANGGMFGAKPQ